MPTPSGSHEVVFAIRGPIRPADLPGLCARVCSILAEHRGAVRCDVMGVPADAVTVDALARLQRGAHGQGCHVVLRNASPELVDLIELMGLSNVFTER
jgi:ABC-type transporter Mla MlaB component